jgi:hypothetical protein
MKKFLVSLRTAKDFRRSLQARLMTLDEAEKIVLVASVSRQEQLDWIETFTTFIMKHNARVHLIVFVNSRKLHIPEFKTNTIRVDRKDFLWTGRLSSLKQQEFQGKASLLINLSRDDDPYTNYIMSQIDSEFNIGVNLQDFNKSDKYDLAFNTTNWNNPEILAKEIASYLKNLKGE